MEALYNWSVRRSGATMTIEHRPPGDPQHQRVLITAQRRNAHDEKRVRRAAGVDQIKKKRNPDDRRQDARKQHRLILQN